MSQPTKARVLVVGGLARLDARYRDALEGIAVDVVNDDSPLLEAKANTAEAVVLVVGNVSHSAAAKVKHAVRRRGVRLAFAAGPSVARVRASISALVEAART